MYARKRNRGASLIQPPPKKQRYDHSSTAVYQSIWKSLPRLSEQEMDIDNAIKHSHIFIRLEIDQKKYLEDIIKAICEVLDDTKFKFYDNFVELKNFHIMDCCVFLSFVMINLNKMWRRSNEADSCTILKPFFLRCPILVHNSCCIPSNSNMAKKTSFSVKLASVTSVPGFKEIQFQAMDLKDLMSGIVSQVSNWDFHAGKQRLTKVFKAALSSVNSQMINAMLQLPFTELLNIEVARKSNTKALVESKKRLDEYATKLNEYNNMVFVQENKSLEDKSNHVTEDSRVSRYSGTSHSKFTGTRYQSTASKQVSANTSAYGQERIPKSDNYVSTEDIRSYCIATVLATMDVVAMKSVYQITRVYIKCPRTLLEALYQKLPEIRSHSNCNIVVLNMQTVHESNAWFDNLNVEKYSQTVPPPNTMRIISIGGVGENCKKALNLLQEFLKSAN